MMKLLYERCTVPMSYGKGCEEGRLRVEIGRNEHSIF